MDRLLLLLQIGKQIFPFFPSLPSLALDEALAAEELSVVCLRHASQSPTILWARSSEPSFSALAADMPCFS